MKYQFKGIAGRWSVYDEKGNRAGTVRRCMGGKLEYQYEGKRQEFKIRRKANQMWLEQDGEVFFSGNIRYPSDADGKPIAKSFFCPPMPEELELERTGETWRLRQRPDRNIEIYYNENRVGILKGMVVGAKTLEWSGDEELLDRGLLCFALGVYMAEDDTVYAV